MALIDSVLNLINNIGHCQGIATALQYCNTNLEFDYIIPMDGDGEDRPEELNNFFSQDVMDVKWIPKFRRRKKNEEETDYNKKFANFKNL